MKKADTYLNTVSYLNTLSNPIVEVRILRETPYLQKEFVGSTISGYYDADNFDKISDDIQRFDADSGTKGIYNTLHRLDPSLLHRSSNKLKTKAKFATSDHDITHFSTFPIDHDPQRPSHISASEIELQTTQKVMSEIKEKLISIGIPEDAMIKAMSGNGYHLQVLIDPFENTTENAERFKYIGDLIAKPHKADETIYNPSRIFKLYGTIGRKGDNTEERPHRRSECYIPESPIRIPFPELEEKIKAEFETQPATFIDHPTASKNPKSNTTSSPKDCTLEEWLTDKGVDYKKVSYKNDSYKYQVDCPHDPNHKSPDAWLTDESGKWQFACSHNSCKNSGKNTWDAFRTAIGHPKGAHGGSRKGAGEKSNVDKAKFKMPEHHKIISLQDSEGFNRQIDDISDETLKILIDAGFDRTGIISRAGMIGTIKYAGTNGYNWERLETPLLSGILSRQICFVNQKVDDNGKLVQTPVMTPPRPIPEDIIHYQAHFNLKKFSELKAIWETPFLYDGKIIDKAGLHEESGFYRPKKTECTLDRPESSEEALTLLKDLFQDFPFKEEADFENALSIPLSLIVRPSFELTDMVPLFNVNASSPGTGKSELCKALITLATGKVSESTKLSDIESEVRKALFARLLAGASYSVFDNMKEEKPFDSAILAGYVSEPVHSDRPLNVSEIKTAENRMLSIFNGNNIEVKFDLVDRGILIDLESPPERSHQREFKYPQLIPHIRKNRSRYLGALIFMIEKWIDDGMPLSKHQHRMRHWIQVIGGIMESNGFGEHLNANAMKYRRDADTESADWARAFGAIYDHYEGNEWAIQDVFTICSFKKSYYHEGEHYPEEGQDILGEYIVARSEDNSRKKSLGRLMKKRIGQTLGGYKLVKCGTKKHRLYYRLEEVKVS